MANSILGFDPTQLSVFSKPEQTSGNFNDNIYHPRPADSKSTDGIYRSTIRVIYSPQDFAKSVLERQSYGLTDAQGFFQVVSKLTNNDTSCPIFSAWKQCRYSKNPVLEAQSTTKDKGGNGLFDKRYERYVTVQILEDMNKPELNGKYMFFKLPKVIWETIQNKMNPSSESNKASIPVMDPLFGRVIYLEVKPGPDDPNAPERKTREISYATTEVSDDIRSCTNPDGSALLNADEQTVLDAYVEAMTKVWKSRNAEERQQLTAQINEDANTQKLHEIYARVIEAMKGFVPDLNAELGYREWTDDMKVRVQNWIDIVLSGKDPKSVIPTAAPAVATPAPTPTAAPIADMGVMPAPAEDNDDLPF